MSGTTTSTTAVATVVPESATDQTCTFTSINPNDQIVWDGICEGIVTYNVAKKFTDLVSYNAAVRQVNPAIPSDLTLHQYVLITLSDAQGNQTQEAFSTYWMTPGSFAIVSQDVSVNVVVYDPATSDHTGILVALRAAGYKCYISGVTS